MNTNQLMDVIGQAQDKYILSAILTKTSFEREGKTNKAKTQGIGRKILIAAAIIALLTLTACAARYISTLFETYFRDEGRQELTSSQIEYIQSNTQPSIAQPIVTEAENEYSVRVRSALTDGKVAYITVEVEAPEDVSLLGGKIRFHENPLLIPQQTEGLVIAPDGSSPDAMCDYETIDDGDGQSNTASIIFHVNPFTQNDNVSPFDGSIHWTMQAGGFYKSVFDPKTMKYSDQELGDGHWEFDLDFQKIDTREVEFVSEPIPIMTSDWILNEYDYENQITSFVLSGLSYQMQLAVPKIGEENQDVGNVSIVMKDGTMQTLLCLTTNSSSLPAPIVLDEVDHILLCDGTELYPVN